MNEKDLLKELRAELRSVSDDIFTNKSVPQKTYVTLCRAQSIVEDLDDIFEGGQ